QDPPLLRARRRRWRLLLIALLGLGPPREIERRILREDRALQIPQLASRLEPEECSLTSLEVADHLGVAAARKIPVEALFQTRQATLLQAGDLALREAAVDEIGQRRPAPHRERFSEPPLFGETLEAVQVELSILDPKPIA